MTFPESQTPVTKAPTFWDNYSRTLKFTAFGLVMGLLLYLLNDKLIVWLDAKDWINPVSWVMGFLYTLAIFIIDRQRHDIDLVVERTKALEKSTKDLRDNVEDFRGDIEKHSFLSKELTASLHSEKFLLPVEPITVTPFPEKKIAGALDVIVSDEFQNLFYSETYVAYLVKKSFHCEDGQGQRLIVTRESTKSLSIFVSIVHSLNQPLYIMHRDEYVKLVKKFASVLYTTATHRKKYEKFFEVSLGNPTVDTLADEAGASAGEMDTKYWTHDRKIHKIPDELVGPFCHFVHACMCGARLCPPKEVEMSAVLKDSQMSDILVEQIENAARNVET